ncbi:MAG: formate dehydrogenase accessory protein FdhE [Gemmatimonadota bacterium]
MRHPERERRRIAQLRRRRPDLEELLEFLDRIAQHAAELIPERFDAPLPSDGSHAQPLDPARFPLDEDRAARAFETFLDAFPADAESPAATAPERVETLALEPRAACRAFLRGDPDYFLDQEERGVAPADLVAEIALLAVKPQFIAAARALGAVPQRVADRCPLCGSCPDLLLVVDRVDQERVALAVCRLCESEWPARRVRCLACGNEDPETLSYLQVEGEEGSRVSVCGACKTYVPVVDTRGRLEVAPAVERAALAHLDVAAERAGYHLVGSTWLRS